MIPLRCGLLDEPDQTLEDVRPLGPRTPERVHHLEGRAGRTLQPAGPDGEAGALVPVSGVREEIDPGRPSQFEALATPRKVARRSGIPTRGSGTRSPDLFGSCP